MQFIRRLLSGCFLILERWFKGHHLIRNITLPEHRDLVGTLTGYSVTGFRITVYCERIVYQKRYTRWYVPHDEITLFRVYSNVSIDAPASLREACSLEITIPPPHPEFISDSYQKEAAIEWYLDLLIHRMRPEDRFNG
jgi:hypothetical protein